MVNQINPFYKINRGEDSLVVDDNGEEQVAFADFTPKFTPVDQDEEETEEGHVSEDAQELADELAPKGSSVPAPADSSDSNTEEESAASVPAEKTDAAKEDGQDKNPEDSKSTGSSDQNPG